MRKVLMFVVTVAVALMAGHAAAADQPVFTVKSFNAPQGDFQAASISAQAITTDRLIATASPSVDWGGNLIATVTFHFSSMDVQNQWRLAGWPGFVDGVEVYLLGSGVMPAGTVIYKGVPPAPFGIPVWSFAHVWTGNWLSQPGIYHPYLTAQIPNIAGFGGSATVVIAPKQMLDMLPESPKDSSGNINYNYAAYIFFDPIDFQMGFSADGVLTMGADGNFKYQGLLFFGRKVNGVFELYTGG